MRLKQINEEVLFADERIVKLGREELDLLIQGSKTNRRGRMRICTHPDAEDELHEMFIVLQQDTYIPPHKHLTKSVSFHGIEGQADLVLFEDTGNVVDIIPLGDGPAGDGFYCRVPQSCFYTQLVRSDYLAFHETISGPFRRSETIWAPWAPEEDSITAGRQFVQQLKMVVDGLISDHRGNA